MLLLFVIQCLLFLLFQLGEDLFISLYSKKMFGKSFLNVDIIISGLIIRTTNNASEESHGVNQNDPAGRFQRIVSRNIYHVVDSNIKYPF